MEGIKELSALDIKFLVREFETLYLSRVETIYQREESVFLLLHKSGSPKKILKIILPNFIYVTEIKEEMPQKPSSFCVVLRKYLKGSRLIKIEQIWFERIIKCTFTSKDIEYILIIELVSPGNILLCNDKGKIIYPLYHHKWKDRTIKGGEIYQPIKKDINVLELTENDLPKYMKKSSTSSIVVFIAKDLGFGGRYAEEICKNAGIDKTSQLSLIEPENLFENITKMLNRNSEINAQLDSLLTDRIGKQVIEMKKNVNTVKTDKLHKTIELQQTILKNLQKSVDINSLTADKIYSNYAKIKEIIDTLRKAREKYNWKDIQSKLKDNAVIKKIDEKTGKITIEVE